MTTNDADGRSASTSWPKRLRRLFPTSLSGRVALVLIICLFAAGTVSTSLYIQDRARATIRIFAQSVAGRIDAIVELMDQTPRMARGSLVQALNSPTLWVKLSQTLPASIQRSWERSGHLTRMVEDHLPRLRHRITAVRGFGDWRTRTDATAWWDESQRPDLMPSRRKLLISIALNDGSKINFIVSSDTTSLRWATRVGVWLLLTAVAIVLFSLWAGRRLTRPLRQFAGAADQLGLDVRAPPLPEQGSRELRRATRAFNGMQERVRRLVDDRTMMLAAISHDLRTMLTRLKLRSEFIEDEVQQQKALADIDEMHAMLEATLSFARSDTELEARTDVDVAVLLLSLCDDVRDTGAAIEYQGPDHLDYRCGPVSFKRAMTNLIDNAVKYGAEASVSLSHGTGQIEINVADRGPGIPAESREKVFTPFYRLEPSRNRETGGSGLGLSVARSIIRRHGGDITLGDREGGGLVVRVTLPDSIEDS